MKLNISIDLQDIFDNQNESAYQDGSEGYCGGDGYNLNEVIKGEIIEGVKNAISKDCMKSVESKSKKAMEDAITSSVNLAKETIEARALEFANDWLEKKTVISDKWGDPVNELTISELIKQQFDNLLERKVDSSGKFDNGYHGSMKLIDYLTGTKVQDEVTKALNSYSRDIDKAVKLHIESGIRESVSNQFAKMVIQTAQHDHKQLESK